MDDGWNGESREPERRRRTGPAPREVPGPREWEDAEPDPADAAACPFAAIGHSGGTYYVFTASGELLPFTHRQLSDDAFEAMCDGDVRWLVAAFPHWDSRSGDLTGFDHRAARRWLMRRCRSRGLFDAMTPTRGQGVWPAADGVLVHCGDVLLRGSPPTITVDRAGCMIDGTLYPAYPPIKRPAEREASAADAQHVFAAMRARWNFQLDVGPDAVVGFIGCGMLGGVPSWHPHLMINARHGSGKTWLSEFVGAALGSAAYDRANDLTKASIEQAMTGQSRVLILDENEPTEEEESKVAMVISLLRKMSDAAGARVMRGSAGGKARSHTITGAAYLSSVLPPRLKPQDRSRITEVFIEPLPPAADPAAAEAAIAACRALSPALWRRALNGAARFQATKEAYRSALVAAGCDHRTATQIGSLMAGRDLLLCDDVPSAEAAREMVEFWEPLVDTAKADKDEGEGESCLNHLYTAPVDLWRTGERFVVADLILQAQDSTTPARDELRRLGMRVEGDAADGWRLYIANRGQGLSRIFHGTRWHGGGWAAALRMMDGARPSPLKLRFVGPHPERCTELGPDLLPAKDGG